MKKDSNHYKTQLEKERAVLVGDLKGVGVKTKGTDDWQATPADIEGDLPDPNEAADRIESFEGNNALVQNLESRLREVDWALQKIKKDTFGMCEIGGEPIEQDRLEANPAARTCKKHLNSHLATPDL
jgi:DnaK suppressor protein